MNIFKRKERLGQTVIVFLAFVILGGCATAIKYSYDTKTNFSEQRSYTWLPSSSMNRQDVLLETNVRTLADQLLAQKGFTGISEKPDLMISMSYEFDSGSYNYGYRLRMLTLNVYITKEQKDLVWRGTAVGTINTDAASGDLRQAIQGILSNFPPK